MRHTARILVAVLLVAGALAGAAAYLLAPALDALRADAEAKLAAASGRSVAIGEFEAGWRGWRPALRVREVRVRERRDDGEPGVLLASLDRLELILDPVASLLRAETRARAIRLGELTLHRRVPIEALHKRLRDAAAWLIAQRRTRVDVERVRIEHLRIAGEPMTLLDVAIVVAAEGERREIEASAALPGGQGERLGARAAFTGNPFSPGAAGEVVVACDDVNAEVLLATRLAPRLEAAAGRVSLEARSRWESGRLAGAEGTLRFRDLALRSRAGRIGPQSGEARLALVETATGWRARLEPRRGLGVYDDGARSSLEVLYTHERGDAPARLGGELGALDVGALRALLPLAVSAPPSAWERVGRLRPRGRLRGVVFSVDAAGGFTAEGRFEGLDGEAAGGVPAFTGLAGRFLVDERIARVDLAGGTLGAELPAGFPQALAGGALRGRLLWSAHGGERRLALRDVVLSTAEVDARVSGEARWPAPGAAPRVSLAVALGEVELARLAPYLPSGDLLGVGLSRWLHRAFSAGRLAKAELALRGRAGARLGDGLSVTALAQVTGVTLDYAGRWPSLGGLDAEIRIDDTSLAATVRAGEVFGARIDEAHVLIPDMSAETPLLSVQGLVRGRTEQAARFLRESPLGEKLGLLVERVEGRGEASLDLGLRLPLGDGDRRVTGRLAVVDNVFDVPGLEEGLRAVEGEFRFDTQSIEAEGVTARYLGRAVRIALDTPPARPRRTRVHVSGSADRAYLARHLANTGIAAAGPVAVLIGALDGETTWQASVDVARTPEPGRDRVRIHVESDMAGVRIALPEPFAKDAAEPLPVVVETRIPRDAERRMEVTVGEQASAAFLLQKRDGAFRMQRAGVRLGGAPPALPAEAGLHVGGHLARFALREWSPLLFGAREEARAGRRDVAPASVDLGVERLAMLGGEFSGVRVKAMRDGAGDWVAMLEGDGLEGRLLVPAAFAERGVVADFEGLVLRPEPGGETGASPDPRSLPPIELTCRRCSIAGVPLELVKAQTSRRADGMDVDNVYVLADAFEAQARGTWTRGDAGERSELDVTLASGNLGELLAALGYEGDATSGGATDVRFNASWPGPPTAFDFARIEGRLEFSASDGTLVDVRRGATGRLFGLLTVTTLPRRLKGDFSDLFGEGFTYERMQGSFNIIGGNAYTRDLTMENATARIHVAGRTGLVDEDYDQYVTVTPKLSSSLPLAPIWLAEKVLQRQVFDKVFAYHYNITGSWDDPNVEKVRVEANPADRS